MGQVTLESGDFGWDYILRAADGRTCLVQTDWDYPGVARYLGWSVAMVEAPSGEPCEHDGTDGTIDCPCGVKAGDFIAHAHQFLDDHEGESFDDPGYFDGEDG